MSIMDGQNTPKLKQILQNVPPGFLIDTAWMGRHGISRQSVSAYVKQGWLERIMQGLYRRPFTPTENPEAISGWKIPLLSAQRLMEYRFHVGGMTALALHGHEHYLALGGRQKVHLYGDAIPEWLFKIRVDGRFVRHSTKLFGDVANGIESGSFDPAQQADNDAAMSPWLWPIRMSTPERAILEALDELPRGESFHNVDVVFESLMNLRPKRLTALLTACKSIKVKRLFFVYADKHAHAWRKHIDAEAIDLGRGDRALAESGKLHPKYRITVPSDLLPGEAADGP